MKHDAVIDGELVALDAQGLSRFQLLQNALRTSANLHYCAFDIMFLGGEDLRGLPLVERKERLKAILPKDPLLIYSEHWPEHGKRLFKEAAKLGLEGIMAKRAQSRYLSGARSKDWLKIKAGKRQEVVIVGFTAPRRSRPYFGALVLAVRERMPGVMSVMSIPGSRMPCSKSPPCEAFATPYRQIAVQAAREGRGRDDLGETEARCRGEVHRVDERRRDAPSGFSRLARGQEAHGRRS